MEEETLNFADLDENSFQAILVISSSTKLSTANWLKNIIDISSNTPNLEFHPVLENGVKLLKFDPSECSIIEPIRCHQALLDNKYYTTQIYLVELDDVYEDFPDKFYEFIHGMIIYFDNNDANCFNDMHKWVKFMDLMDNCSIRILACETATEQDIVSRTDIQNYCIDKGFELVDLKPYVDSDNEYDEDEILEDDFKESNSFERICQAIQAYVWPNLNYKEKGCYRAATFISKATDDVIINKINQLNLENSEVNNVLPAAQTQQPPVNNNNNHSQETISQEQAESFENLFSKFAEIKEKAIQLSDEERRRYAEQVAMSFWNSVNGDPDEIMGFSSDDNDHDEDNDPMHVYI